jgi:cytochrome c-type biogenesis protein CcmE
MVNPIFKLRDEDGNDFELSIKKVGGRYYLAYDGDPVDPIEEGEEIVLNGTEYIFVNGFLLINE